MSKTYLVTGAAGFIGSRFVESLKERGISAISVDQKSYFTEREELQGIQFGQIIDRDDLLSKLPEISSPDAVIHLGACADTMETDVDFLYRNNVQYSEKLWSFCTEKKIPFFYASSAATYGGGEQGYDDDEKILINLQPLNPYGDSKHIFDQWALQQEKMKYAPPAWAGFKFFNVYGFGERHKGKMASVILHACDQIAATGGMKLFRSHRNGIKHGEQKRDFVSVEDVISVIHFAIEKPIRRGIFNLGTGQAQTFVDLANAVFSALDKPVNIEFIDMPEEIRERYQYFTEAKMDRLKSEGYTKPFADLTAGTKGYVAKLLASKA